MRAKKKDINRLAPSWSGNELEKIRLQRPADTARKETEILGHGAPAAPQVVELLRKLNLLG